MTFTVTISPHGTEYVQCFHGGGTKNEYFSQYFEGLVELLLEKYKDKTVVVLLDNLWAHKSQQVIKIVQSCDRLKLLLTPSNSP